MPTILLIAGWRFFFYSNENNEPIHIHVERADAEAKFWIDVKEFEITEAFAYKFSPRDKREVKKIIYEHLDYIIDQWNKFQKKK